MPQWARAMRGDTLLLWMLIPFLYFMTVGANTFIIPKLRDTGAVLGQLSFVSGMFCVLCYGLVSRPEFVSRAMRRRIDAVLGDAL
jgi:hypothetical protein